MTTIPTISHERASKYASMIYEQIPQFCREYESEYIEFLSGRASFYDSARKEYERITGRFWLYVLTLTQDRLIREFN